MKVVSPALLIIAFSCSAALAQDAPRAEDRAAIDACLQRELNIPERCIGSVYQPCTETPAKPGDDFSPDSTPGREICAARETAVWQEKADASLKTLREGPIGQVPAQPYNRPSVTRLTHPIPGAALIDDMEKAWAIWSLKACDIEGLRYEGGTLARIIYATCINRETARHALWLKKVESD